VFAPSSLFVGPANLVARPGDWLAARRGREPMILWRDMAGAAAGVHQSLPALRTRPRQGRTRFDRAARAAPAHPHETDLTRVAQLAVHRGLVFASLDPAALPFLEWLAPFAVLSTALRRHDGSRRRTPPELALRRQLESWRWSGFAATSTADARRTLRRMPRAGGAMGGARDPGPAFTLFPNLSFEARTASLQVWHPVAPDPHRSRHLVPGRTRRDAGGSRRRPPRHAIRLGTRRPF